MTALFDGWASLCIQAWRAFIVFGGLVIAGAAYVWKTGGYDGLAFAEIVDDVFIGLVLMFLVSFITSIIYHCSVWRNRDRTLSDGSGRRDSKP